MYYDTPFSHRFDKPAAHAVIDLINLSNHVNFEYNEIVVGAPVALTTPVDGRNTRITATLTGRDDPKGATTLFYNRLDFAKFIGPLPVYVQTAEMSALQATLDRLNELFSINIDETQCVIDWLFEEAAVDETWPILVNPHDDHLVWVGQALVYAVPEDHIALSLPTQVLPGLLLAQVVDSSD